MHRDERFRVVMERRAVAAEALTNGRADPVRRAPAGVAGPVLLRGSAVAVLPFDDLSGSDDAARVAAAIATVELRRRGSFTVIEPWQVRDRLAAAGLAGGGWSTAPELDGVARALGADAVLAGLTTTFEQGGAGRCVRFGVSLRLVRAVGGPPLLSATGSEIAEGSRDGTGLRSLGRRTIERLLGGLRAVDH